MTQSRQLSVFLACFCTFEGPQGILAQRLTPLEPLPSMADPFPKSGLHQRGLLLSSESEWLHSTFPGAAELDVSKRGVIVVALPYPMHSHPVLPCAGFRLLLARGEE